jgi:hypothetical protein
LEAEVSVQSIDSPPTPLTHLPWTDTKARLAARQKEWDRRLDRISSEQILWDCIYVDDVTKEGLKGQDSPQES